MTGTVILPERSEHPDRAQEYDRALRQSQHAAAVRKRHQAGASGGSILVGNPASSNIFQSTIGGAAMAQTAVLGDSQGSITLSPPLRPRKAVIPDEDFAADGGVGSGLGGSYVDGEEVKRSKPKPYSQQEDGDEDEGLADGGVLGLLAQIYGAKGQGPARVI